MKKEGSEECAQVRGSGAKAVFEDEEIVGRNPVQRRLEWDVGWQGLADGQQIVPQGRIMEAGGLVDNLLPFLLKAGSTGGGVAHGAHIGGFGAGIGLAWLLDRRQLRVPPKLRRGFAPVSTPAPAPAEAITLALRRGAFAEAATAYFRLDAPATRRLLAPTDALALADWLAQAGHAEPALVIYRRHLRDYPMGPGLAEAHAGAGLVQLESLGQVAPAYQHFLEALDANPPPDLERRVRAVLQTIAQRQKYPLRRLPPC